MEFCSFIISQLVVGGQGIALEGKESKTEPAC